jgi:hypothetical protein
MTLVPFLDRAERDVRQQRRQDSTLGSAGICAGELIFRKNAGSQESSDESIHLRVSDAPAQPAHQLMVIDVIEAPLDVPLNGPLIREPVLAFTRADGPRPQEHPKMLEGAVDSSAGAKAVRDRKEVCLEDRLQNALQRCLHDPIGDGGNAEGPILPGGTRLRDQHPSHGARSVLAEPQRLAYVKHEALSPAISHELRHRDSVHARCAATSVAADALQGASQRPGINEEPPELAKDEVEIVPTPTVEHALDVPPA